jgi:rSAM/selenodomain-associated transferase 2
MPLSIAVIVPALNEEALLQDFLTALLDREGDFRVVLADGGSSDRTLDIARRFSRVRRVSAEKGRGLQMNAGAREATEDVLLFLHADTFLPADAFGLIRQALADPAVAGGCFRLAFDRDDPWLRFYSFFSRINQPLFTYGDQGLFVRREVFQRIGGFREMPILEDVEIQERLRRAGRFVKLRQPVMTSARRFVRYGPVRQQALNAGIVLLYNLGVPPARLKRLYADWGPEPVRSPAVPLSAPPNRLLP